MTAQPTSSGITSVSLTGEKWREYEFGPEGSRTTYRISAPILLFQRPGGTTHRVMDTLDVIHCVPAPGHQGCVLRWAPMDPLNPVQF